MSASSAIQDVGQPLALDGDAWLYVGNDPKTGAPLKTIAVPDDKRRSDLTIIHCSPLVWHAQPNEGSDRDA